MNIYIGQFIKLDYCYINILFNEIDKEYLCYRIRRLSILINEIAANFLRVEQFVLKKPKLA